MYFYISASFNDKQNLLSKIKETDAHIFDFYKFEQEDGKSAIKYSSQIVDVLIKREKTIQGVDSLSSGIKRSLVCGALKSHDITYALRAKTLTATPPLPLLPDKLQILPLRSIYQA